MTFHWNPRRCQRILDEFEPEAEVDWLELIAGLRELGLPLKFLAKVSDWNYEGMRSFLMRRKRGQHSEPKWSAGKTLTRLYAMCVHKPVPVWDEKSPPVEPNAPRETLPDGTRGCTRCGKPRAPTSNSYCRECKNAITREVRKPYSELSDEQKRRATARSAAKMAVRRGKLVPQPCEACGARAEMHHDDYSKPLDVRWLCTTHHRAHHAASV